MAPSDPNRPPGRPTEHHRCPHCGYSFNLSVPDQSWKQYHDLYGCERYKWYVEQRRKGASGETKT